MQYPKDAVLVKTLKLDVLTAKGQIETRVETQLLHHDGKDWRGYSYAWRDDQSDADLVPADGAEKLFPVAPGGKSVKGEWSPVGKREQVWTFHSRAQCLSCHNAWSEYSLAFNPRQLNRLPLFGGGTTEPTRAAHQRWLLPPRLGRRQGTTVVRRGLCEEGTGARELDLGRATRHTRGVTCTRTAHCHRFGGGGGQVVLELDITKPLKDTGILDVRPKQGDFGLADAHRCAG